MPGRRGGVNLAQRPSDGDEIYVPAAGEMHDAAAAILASRPPGAGAHRHRPVSVDVNAPCESSSLPFRGSAAAIAQRIVELREREGSFASLDELLDVAGMTHRASTARARFSATS